MTETKSTILPMRASGDLDPLTAILSPGSRVVEVGSYAGESAEQFMLSGKVSNLTCVDDWRGGYDDGDIASKSNMVEVRKRFDARIRPFRRQVLAFAMPSLEAASYFMPESLDMVYVDGSHVFKDVLNDLTAWLPKVKIGGWIAGHDFHKEFPDVVRAVMEVVGKPDCLFSDTSWAKRRRT